jgi:hypothetical protein
LRTVRPGSGGRVGRCPVIDARLTFVEGDCEMVIKRVAPLSVAKIAGTLYAAIGVLIGAVVSLIGVAGAFAANQGADNPMAGPFAFLFGAGAIVAFPLFYGCIGFIGSLIMAGLYNLVAGAVGGVQIETE